MARMYKMAAYLVDPNETYKNAEEWFEEVISKSNIFCPTPINHEAVSFEWDDELPINYIGCKESDCEAFFAEQYRRFLLERLTERLKPRVISPVMTGDDDEA